MERPLRPGAWRPPFWILPLAGAAVLDAALASNTAFQTGTALGVAIVTTLAVSRSQQRTSCQSERRTDLHHPPRLPRR